MGDRKNTDIYFTRIKGTMASAAALANGDTTIVQMVAFSDSCLQLPRYLAVMEEAGLEEVFYPPCAVKVTDGSGAPFPGEGGIAISAVTLPDRVRSC